MRTTTLTIFAGALLLLLATGPAVATEELAEAEALQCTSCHDKPGSKLLTGQGKYYEVMRTLDGYDAVTRVFGECTSCHKRKPGSTKLTSTGRRFAEVIGDMEGLKALLLMEHPTPPPESPESELEGAVAPPALDVETGQPDDGEETNRHQEAREETRSE